MARELSSGTHGMASVKPNDEDMSALAKISHFHHGWNRIFCSGGPSHKITTAISTVSMHAKMISFLF
jgi:hypothetical protein